MSKVTPSGRNIESDDKLVGGERSLSDFLAASPLREINFGLRDRTETGREPVFGTGEERTIPE
jgi:hypothetical protein